MARPRVLLADDHTLLLEGYRKLLEDHFEVVGTASDGRQLLDLTSSRSADLVLIDVSMPGLNGIDAARRLSAASPKTRILMVSMHNDPDYVLASLRAGAAGFVLKSAGWSDLLRAMKEVLNGGTYISPMIAGEAMDMLRQRHEPAGSELLTLRQREVLQLVAEGRTAQEIAGVLKISIKTVEFHKARIMQQLGVRSVAGLTSYALRHGLLA